ncbi:MAG: c-type cytochrome, partial [Gammaproteobacteria bacterium]|nr:c-type cytochrome [Gammaproteobacteria bacterium]
TCKVCHGPGLAGAPALGDADAWKPRIAQGQDVLTRHALTGFEGRAGQMPARGGNDALSDADVAAAVRYMVARSQ